MNQGHVREWLSEYEGRRFWKIWSRRFWLGVRIGDTINNVQGSQETIYKEEGKEKRCFLTLDWNSPTSWLWIVEERDGRKRRRDTCPEESIKSNYEESWQTDLDQRRSRNNSRFCWVWRIRLHLRIWQFSTILENGCHRLNWRRKKFDNKWGFASIHSFFGNNSGKPNLIKIIKLQFVVNIFLLVFEWAFVLLLSSLNVNTLTLFYNFWSIC